MTVRCSRTQCLVGESSSIMRDGLKALGNIPESVFDLQQLIVRATSLPRGTKVPLSSSIIIGKLSQCKDKYKCKTHACKEPNRKDHQAAEVAFLAKVPYGKDGLTGKDCLLIIISADHMKSR